MTGRDTAPPALLHGGPLPPLTVPTLGEALVRAARLGGPGDIRHLDAEGAEHRQSYAGLLTEAEHVLAGIRAAGVPEGGRVVLRPAHSPDLFTAFWACVLGGFVPVPMSGTPAPDGPSVAELLTGVWETVDGAWLISDEPPAGTPFTGRWLGGVEGLRGAAPDRSRYRADPDEPALLMLTAGSSGRPKAVTLTHRNVMSRSLATSLARGLSPGTRSFNWMPLEHVGGLVMFHVRDVFLGCHQVHAPTRWVLDEPLRWLDAMSRYGSDTTWAPNFAFGLIAERVERAPGRAWDLRRLRYIMNGGEAVKARVARRFLEALAPHGLRPTAIHPGWGMSETSAGVIDCVFSPETATGRFVPVGAPHPGVSVRIVDEHGRVRPQGALGRLEITGPPVTPGYFGDPAHNRGAFTPDGWFTTDDLAFIENGLVTVTGRADDVIEVGGAHHHGHEIEAAVEELPSVEPSFTVACAVPATAGGPGRLAVFFHPRPGASPAATAEEIRRRIRERFGVEASHVEPVEKHEVPKTSTGKLRRGALAERLTGCANSTHRVRGRESSP
ncbi:AMP-binding protein [Streptomyces sp. SP18CS02]|uniref:AMP-binding protein n=1 Tax=Streptomyces sp. SP18CS02 TaxID=3002531 RepID=UPI002E774D05|nr:AMP-binding protein [Streptomyces sp. SP18CS02]MEE1757282.1 AMP-binding protein [Streptomyces sp. SP18CS02]